MDLSRLTTETRNAASAEIDRLSPLEIVRLMNAQDAEVPAAIAAVAEPMAAAMRVIADRLRNGGRLIYVGAGTSGRLGVLDAAECPPTFNSRPWQVLGVIAGGSAALTRAVEGAEDLPEQAVADLQHVRLSARDAVVGIATSGRTPYVLGGLRSARACGAVTIGITCNQDSELARISDHLIVPVVGPEVITGSTRLKAGTATKLVLNTLSTGAMVLLGKTYGNLMVDLQCTNQKLADRSRRIVGELAEVDPARAEQLLDACHGDTKTAIVAARRGLSPREAQAWLTRWDGHLRDALHQPLPDDRLGPDTAIHQPQPTADLLLAIDGGGSKTACRLVEFRGGSSRPLGESGAGPSNPNTVGWAAALDNIEHAVTLAFSAAGLPRRPAAAACLAIAGGGREDHRQRILRWAETRELAEQINVTHDALPVLAAGTPRGHGIAIIAGTGSIAFGRDPAGRTARSGGRGYLFGDQGSGYAIARAGLQAAAEAVDHGASASGLVAALLAATDTRDFEQLSQLLYRRQSDQAWLASLATAVCQAALDGDTAALAILDQAADALVAMAQVVLGSLGENPAWGHPPIALGGSMLTRTAIFRQRVTERLQRLEPAVATIQIVEDPLSGVLRLAEQTIRFNPLCDHPPDKPASTWDGPEET